MALLLNFGTLRFNECTTKNDSQDQIVIQFNGQISFSRQSVKMFQAELNPEHSVHFCQSSAIINSPEKSGNKRLAYTVRESAEILGISYITAHRLIKHGLLRNSTALRNKIIPTTEIQRFLKKPLKSSIQ